MKFNYKKCFKKQLKELKIYKKYHKKYKHYGTYCDLREHRKIIDLYLRNWRFKLKDYDTLELYWRIYS